jgi:hypothetical protein
LCAVEGPEILHTDPAPLIIDLRGPVAGTFETGVACAGCRASNARRASEENRRPDIIVVVGDRIEASSACSERLLRNGVFGRKGLQPWRGARGALAEPN